MSKYKHKFASLAPISSNIRPHQPQGVGSHLGADKGMGTSFLFSKKHYREKKVKSNKQNKNYETISRTQKY
jgi:hypothetical protein